GLLVDLELGAILVMAALFGAWCAWRLFRGQTVGTLRASAQRDTWLPGARVTVAVKRHPDNPHAPDVELQFRILGVPTSRRLDAADAKRLAEALERSLPWIRGES